MCSFLSVDEPESILAKELSRVDSGFIRCNYSSLTFIPAVLIGPQSYSLRSQPLLFANQNLRESLKGSGLAVGIAGAAAVGDRAKAALPAWGGRPDKFEGFHQGARCAGADGFKQGCPDEGQLGRPGC